MASPARQTNSASRNNSHSSLSYRPSQRLLTASDLSTPIRVVARKRVIVKQEEPEAPVLSKVKYEHEVRNRRQPVPTQKVRETGGSTFVKPSPSNYSNERSYEYSAEDDGDYEEYYDQLPPRLSNTPKSESPIKTRKYPASIVSIGKSVVTGRKDNVNQDIDVQHLIEKYVNSETQKETEAWLINIGLCEKLNSVTRDVERMRGEMSEMWEYMNQLKSKDGYKDRFTMQTRWPGGMGGGASRVTPFGVSPAPNPLNEGDYIVPPMYAKNGVDCRDIYNNIQRKGKKRPGVVFLTHFIRDLCAVAIEAPHKYILTIRSRNRKDELIHLSPHFIKPIESFFLAACNVTNGLTYALGDMLREALANELRELRRAPRKEKVTLSTKMLKMLRQFEAHPISLLDDENGEENEDRRGEIERNEDEDEDEDHEDMVMEEEEVEVEDEI